jgi:transposase
MSKKSRTSNLNKKIEHHLAATKDDWTTKEALAKKFGAREHEISQVLHRLNLKGLVAQPKHMAHCTEPWGAPRRCSAWLPDIYKINRK